MTTRLARFVQPLINPSRKLSALKRGHKVRAKSYLPECLESRVLLSGTFYHAGDLDPTFNAAGVLPGTLTYPITSNGGPATISYPAGFWGYANIYKSALQSAGALSGIISDNLASHAHMVVVSTVNTGIASNQLGAYTDSQGNPITVGNAISISWFNVDTGTVDLTQLYDSTSLPAYFITGTATEPGPRSIELGGVAIQADGKIVIAGSTSVFPQMGGTQQVYDTNAFVLRLLPNGLLDSKANDPTTWFDRKGTPSLTITAQGEGKVDGLPDDGLVIYDFARGQETINAVALGAGGRIYIGGTAVIDPFLAGNRALLVSFNPDGSIDNGFGTDGRVVVTANATEPPVPTPGPPFYWQSAQYGDYFGNCSDISVSGTPLANFLTNATLLSNVLGADGLPIRLGTVTITLTPPLPPPPAPLVPIVFNLSFAGSVTIGDIIQKFDAAMLPYGATMTFDGLTFVVNADPTNKLDISDPAGVTNPTTTGVSLGIVGNAPANGSFTGGALASVALISNGFPLANRAFNNGPIPGENARTYDDQFQQVAVQPDGKIIVAGQGYAGAPTNTQIIIGRYNVDGTVDTTFGVNGFFTKDFVAGGTGGGGEEAINSLALQADGSGGWNVVFAGYAVPANGNNPALSRLPTSETLLGVLKTNGQLNTSFGGTGFVAQYYPGSNSFFTNVQLQSDGKIIAAGSAASSTGQGVLLVRYNADGSLDHNFGVAGMAIERIDNTTTAGAWFPGNYDSKSDLKHPAFYSAGASSATDLPVGLYLNPVNGTIELVGYSITTPPFVELSVIGDGKAVFSPAKYPGQTIVSSMPVAPYAQDASSTIGFVEMLRFTNDTPNFATDSVPPQSSLLNPTPVNIAASTYRFTLQYTDNSNVRFSSISNSNAYVTGPNGYSSPATVVSITTDSAGLQPASANSPVLYVTYSISTPTINGSYIVHLNSLSVSDVFGNFAVAGNEGVIVVFAPDTDTPQAVLNAKDLSTTAGPPYQFTVNYTDNISISAVTVNSNNILVTGPSGYTQVATLVSRTPNFDNTAILAAYRITAPLAGNWVDGIYSLTLLPNSVADTAFPITDQRESFDASIDPAIYPTQSHFVTGGTMGTFQITQPDLIAPTAVATAANVTVPSATYQFQVTYSDNLAMSYASVQTGALTVSGPQGFSQVATIVSISPNTDSMTLNAVYQITAPGGLWSSQAAGTYSITLAPNSVMDTSGNGVAPGGLLATFSVQFPPPPPDNQAPTVTGFHATPVTFSGPEINFSVDYADNKSVNIATLGNGNITVIGPDGRTYTAVFTGVDIATPGTPRTASYKIVAPAGGSFTANFNGLFTVNLNANQVKDFSDNPVAAQTLGTILVNVADLDPPTATATAPTITTPSTGGQTITVNLIDFSGIDVSTLGNSNIYVTGPKGFSQNATFVSVNNAANGSPRTAVFTVNGPGGSWDGSFNGTFSIWLRANQIADTLGHRASADQVIGSFALNTTDVPPDATMAFNDFAGVQNGFHFFELHFHDSTGLATASFTNANAIQVIGPDGRVYNSAYVANSLVMTGTTQARATFSILPTGLVWDEHAVGAYNVFVVGGQVADINGRFMPRQNIGTFYFSPSIYFSERYYDGQYADVANAIHAGAFTSGWNHFQVFGQFEHRNPSPFYNDNLYLALNQDVATAVANQQVVSGWQHYMNFGQFENRTASGYFDPQFYLAHNPLVAAAVASGDIPSALQHYLDFGIYESRDPSPLVSNLWYITHYADALNAVQTGLYRSGLEQFFAVSVTNNLDRSPSPFFDSTYYLANNTDLAQALTAGHINSALEHFLTTGIFEQRKSSANFDQDYYLATYPAVQAAISGHQISSALYHYVTFGQFQGYNPLAGFNESFYLTTYPDVKAAVDAGLIHSGYEHYLIYGRFEGRSPHA